MSNHAQKSVSLRKVLITGAGGLLGTPTVKAFAACRATKALGLGHRELDITNAELVRSQVAAFGPDLVINCAAYTNVDACETNEAAADRVNGEGAGNVARAAAACGAKLIHLSTDYVFDGSGSLPYTEDHPAGGPSQLCAYGRSKLLGEQCVRQNHPAAIIVRTAWLYGHDGPCFPRAILNRARSAEPLRVVTDQIGSPTYAPDLAAALCKLSDLDVAGFFHVTNADRCTWLDFSRAILQAAGLDVPIEGITAADLNRPAKRPAFSILDNGRYIAATGSALRPWREALSDYLASLPNTATPTGAGSA